MIELRVLGRIELRADGAGPLSPHLQPKPFALLVYLALEAPRGFLRRDTLAATFWGERDQSHARSALRKALHHLRQRLGAGVIRTQGDEEVGLTPGAAWCDAVAFEDALRAREFANAVELYQGDLLPGLFQSDAPQFEDWLESTRGRLRQRAVEAAWSLAEHDKGQSDIRGAVRWAQEAMRLAPYDEVGFRRLVVLLGELGDRARGVRAYAILRKRLAELNLEPSPQTAALLDATVRSERPRTADREAAWTAPAAAAPAALLDRG